MSNNHRPHYYRANQTTFIQVNDIDDLPAGIFAHRASAYIFCLYQHFCVAKYGPSEAMHHAAVPGLRKGSRAHLARLIHFVVWARWHAVFDPTAIERTLIPGSAAPASAPADPSAPARAPTPVAANGNGNENGNIQSHNQQAPTPAHATPLPFSPYIYPPMPLAPPRPLILLALTLLTRVFAGQRANPAGPLTSTFTYTNLNARFGIELRNTLRSTSYTSALSVLLFAPPNIVFLAALSLAQKCQLDASYTAKTLTEMFSHAAFDYTFAHVWGAEDTGTEGIGEIRTVRGEFTDTELKKVEIAMFRCLECVVEWRVQEVDAVRNAIMEMHWADLWAAGSF